MISGEVNPLSAAVFCDLALNFSNIDMTTVNPYSAHFAGYQIRKGKLSVDLLYKIDDRKLNASHHIRIDQLELGDHVDSPDATHLPVRLAVALLKDRNGLIDINFPVTGSLDDPQFRIAPIVWKIVINLIEKAVTAPFALLGSLFGSSEQINEIAFATGTATLDAQSEQRLVSVRKALIERPGLEIEVPAAWSPDKDRAAVLHQKLESHIAAVPAKAGTDRYHQLLAVYRSEIGAKTALPPLASAFEADLKRPRDAQAPAEATAELESAVLAHYSVSDDELAELGKARAAAVQAALLQGGEIAPTRVFVTNVPPAGADDKLLRINLALK